MKKRRPALATAALALVAAVALGRWPPLPLDHVGTWMGAAGVRPRYETVDGLRLRYVRKGSGPPVVLLHGLASSLYTWKDVLPVLAARHDTIALDLPAFGGSDVPDAADGERMVRSVLGLLDRIGVARASFAGNSLGGALSVVIAARQPQRVDRLVLLDAAGYNFEAKDRPWVLRVAGRAPRALADAVPLRPMVTVSLRQVFHEDALVTADRIAEYVAPLQRPGARAAVRDLLAQGEALGFPAIIRSVKAPTLVVWGRHDAWIPLGDAARFAADIPGAQVAVLEAGHMPQEERPAETASLMRGFLSPSPPPHP